MIKNTHIYKLLFLCLFPNLSNAQSLSLDFGSISDSTFGVSGTEIQYLGVATGINATLTTSNFFTAQTPANHGSVTGAHTGAEGDVRINMTSSVANTDPNNIDNGAIFTLSLWDANTGDGFSTEYTSVSSFDWDMNFYDIDAGTVNTNGFFTYDYLRIMSPGTYTVMDTTTLDITTNVDGSVSFSGVTTGARTSLYPSSKKSFSAV